jgi:hypothetical protein
VAAGLRDHRPPPVDDLEYIELFEDVAADPLQALSAVLEGSELWSVADGREADIALREIPDWVGDEEYDTRWTEAHDRTAARLMTGWHRARLERLVLRMEQRLPFEGYPGPSAAIAAACARFAEDETFRLELAAVLLSDLLPRPWLPALQSAFAA